MKASYVSTVFLQNFSKRYRSLYIFESNPMPDDVANVTINTYIRTIASLNINFQNLSRRVLFTSDQLQLATGNWRIFSSADYFCWRIFGQLMILAERSIISVSQYLAEKILRNLRNYTFVYILVFTEESEEWRPDLLLMTSLSENELWKGQECQSKYLSTS